MELKPIDLPNLRRLIIPPKGHVILNLDLERADAHVVAWEADCLVSKAIFRSRADIHLENAKSIWGAHVTKDTRTSNGAKHRDLAKNCIHATNYGCTARTLADKYIGNLGDAEHFLTSWFLARPKIKDWHRRVEWQLEKDMTVHNVWGFRRFYTDRPKDLLPKALAWIGQSTVAITINKIFKLVDQELPSVTVRLQGHDSLLMYAPIASMERDARHLLDLANSVVLPYTNDNLIIPCSLEWSAKSWSDCQPWQEAA